MSGGVIVFGLLTLALLALTIWREVQTRREAKRALELRREQRRRQLRVIEEELGTLSHKTWDW